MITVRMFNVVKRAHQSLIIRMDDPCVCSTVRIGVLMLWRINMIWVDLENLFLMLPQKIDLAVPKRMRFATKKILAT